MVRAVLYALITIFAITFIRMAIGIITKGFADLMREESDASRTQRASTAKPTPTRGELKACSTCGTYVVASQALTGPAQGETRYYCSQECKAKSAAA